MLILTEISRLFPRVLLWHLLCNISYWTAARKSTHQPSLDFWPPTQHKDTILSALRSTLNSPSLSCRLWKIQKSEGRFVPSWRCGSQLLQTLGLWDRQPPHLFSLMAKFLQTLALKRYSLYFLQKDSVRGEKGSLPSSSQHLGERENQGQPIIVAG